MSRLSVQPATGLRGCLGLPGDKSISHRAAILGALAEGPSSFSGFLRSGDCLATVDCLQQLGVQIDLSENGSVRVLGRGLRALAAPRAPLDCRRSGTTMRLLAGVLSGQEFDCTLTGDPQLLRRPMKRIVEPLARMGGRIESDGGHGPLHLHGSSLFGCAHKLSVASAQVKSALLLAGLYAEGPTVIDQPGPARDHTERMLTAMGADIHTRGLRVELAPPARLRPVSFHIPGDFSSAAFLLVVAALAPRSALSLLGVGVNPTRTGLLEVLSAMGAEIQLQNCRTEANEPVADLGVRTSTLVGTFVRGNVVVRMIDELPVFAVAASQARGATVVRDAAELRVKETDRIATIVSELRALGACIEPLADGFVVQGPTVLHGGAVDSHGDHRLAMALCVAGLLAQEKVVIDNTECIDDSFPGFVRGMREIGAQCD